MPLNSLTTRLLFHPCRAMEIDRWKRELEKLLYEVTLEHRTLEEAKEACERALEAKVIPTEVVTECLSLREGRREFEVSDVLQKRGTIIQHETMECAWGTCCKIMWLN